MTTDSSSDLDRNKDLVAASSSSSSFTFSELFDTHTNTLLPQMQDSPLPYRVAVCGGGGFVSGYLVRTFGRAAIAGLGSMFATMQLLHYMGYLDTRKMRQDIVWGASMLHKNASFAEIMRSDVPLEDRLRTVASKLWDIARKNALLTGAFAVGLAAAFK